MKPLSPLKIFGSCLIAKYVVVSVCCGSFNINLSWLKQKKQIYIKLDTLFYLLLFSVYVFKYMFMFMCFSVSVYVFWCGLFILSMCVFACARVRDGERGVRQTAFAYRFFFWPQSPEIEWWTHFSCQAGWCREAEDPRTNHNNPFVLCKTFAHCAVLWAPGSFVNNDCLHHVRDLAPCLSFVSPVTVALCSLLVTAAIHSWIPIDIRQISQLFWRFSIWRKRGFAHSVVSLSCILSVSLSDIAFICTKNPYTVYICLCVYISIWKHQ